jgi:hypothetical protein
MRRLWKLWYVFLEDVLNLGFDYVDIANKIKRTGYSSNDEWKNYEHDWYWEDKPKIRH